MTLRLRIAEDALDIAETLVFGARMTWPNCHVTVAQTGAEAVQQFTTESVDLVILDVNMPVLDGFDVCQCIRSTSSVPILMSTVRSEVLDKVRALDLWADDYVTNPCDHLELFARLRALLRRSRETVDVDNSVFISDDVSIDFAAGIVHVQGEIVHLTSTECRLLEVLVRNAGIVVPQQRLLEQAWGPEYVGDRQYLKVFVQRLRRKLGDDAASPRYIHT